MLTLGKLEQTLEARLFYAKSGVGPPGVINHENPRFRRKNVADLCKLIEFALNLRNEVAITHHVEQAFSSRPADIIRAASNQIDANACDTVFDEPINLGFRNIRLDDGDAAKPFGVARERIEGDRIVGLIPRHWRHNEAVGNAMCVEDIDELLDRRRLMRCRQIDRIFAVGKSIRIQNVEVTIGFHDYGNVT